MAVKEGELRERVACRVLFDKDGTLTKLYPEFGESVIAGNAKAFHEQYSSLCGIPQPDYLTARSRGEILNNLKNLFIRFSTEINEADSPEELKNTLDIIFKMFEESSTENLLKTFGPGIVCSMMDLQNDKDGNERKPGDYYESDLKNFEKECVEALKKELYDYLDTYLNKKLTDKQMGALRSNILKKCTRFIFEKEKTDVEDNFKNTHTKADQLKLFLSYYPTDLVIIFEDSKRHIDPLEALNKDDEDDGFRENFGTHVIVVRATSNKTVEQYWEECQKNCLLKPLMDARFKEIKNKFQQILANPTPNRKELSVLCDNFTLVAGDYQVCPELNNTHVELLKDIKNILKKPELSSYSQIKDDIISFIKFLKKHYPLLQNTSKKTTPATPRKLFNYVAQTPERLSSRFFPTSTNSPLHPGSYSAASSVRDNNKTPPTNPFWQTPSPKNKAQHPNPRPAAKAISLPNSPQNR